MICDEIAFEQLLKHATMIQRFQTTDRAQKEIEIRAYELYLSRGGIDGHDLEDWLQAEREVTTGRGARN